MSKLYSQVIDFLEENNRCFLRLKQTGSPAKPVAVSIAVTGRCNSGCIMCSIWKLSKTNHDLLDREMQIQDILKLLHDPFLSDLVEIDITGGEPHLRDDLVEIVFAVAELKKSVLPKLKTIIVPSNGLLTKKILQRTQMILKYLKNTGIDFVSVTSLDGLGPVHDTIRGIRGSYEKTSKTIAGLVDLKKEYPGYFWPGIKTTVSRTNIHQLESIFDFAAGNQLFSIISAVIITQSRFRNLEFKKHLELGPNELDKIKAFYASVELEHDFYASKIRDSMINGQRQWTCTAGYNYAFIDFDKKVYPCPIQDVCLGDLNHDTFGDIMTGEKACLIRQQVGSYPLCRQCTEPGTIRYSQILQGSELLNFLKVSDMKRFQEAVVGHGLHKFLS